MTMNEYAQEIDRKVAEGLRIIGLLNEGHVPSLPPELPQASPSASNRSQEADQQKIFRTTLGNTSR